MYEIELSLNITLIRNLIKELVKRISKRCDLDFTVNSKYAQKIIASEYYNLDNAIHTDKLDKYLDGWNINECGQLYTGKIDIADSELDNIVKYIWGDNEKY